MPAQRLGPFSSCIWVHRNRGRSPALSCSRADQLLDSVETECMLGAAELNFHACSLLSVHVSDNVAAALLHQT